MALEQVDEDYLRRAVALIPQEAYVFAGTAQENLTYLQPRATPTEIDHAVAAIGLQETISRLGGYDAKIPTGGGTLSPESANSSRWRGSTCLRPRSSSSTRPPGTVAQREDVVRHSRCVRCIRRVRPILPPPSAFTGFRFPREVIVLAVRWYLRYGLSYRDVEELLAERGVQVDHVTIYRWVQRFTPLLIDAARPCRHVPGDRWFVDETSWEGQGVAA